MALIRDFFTELYKLFKPFLLLGVIVGIVVIVCATVSMAVDAVGRRKRNRRLRGGFEGGGGEEIVLGDGRGWGGALAGVNIGS